MLRRFRIAAVVAAVAVLATGCFEADVTIDVADDGSGQVITIFALDAERLESAFGAFEQSMGGEGNTDLCETLAPPELVDGGTVEGYQHDDLCGYRSVEPFAGPEDLKETLNGYLPASTGVPAVDAVSLTPAGEDLDGWAFSLTLPSDEALLTDLPDNARELFGFDESAFVIRVKLPGTVVEHNGDRVEDGHVVWEIDITDPPSGPLTARSAPADSPEALAVADTSSSDGSGGGGVAAVAVVGALLVAAAVAVVVLLKRRRPVETH